MRLVRPLWLQLSVTKIPLFCSKQIRKIFGVMTAISRPLIDVVCQFFAYTFLSGVLLGGERGPCSAKCIVAGQLPYAVADIIISYVPNLPCRGCKRGFNRVRQFFPFTWCCAEQCTGGGWIGVDNRYDSFGLWDPQALSNEITCFNINDAGLLEVCMIKISQRPFKGSVELSAWKVPDSWGGYCLVAAIYKKLRSADGSGWHIAANNGGIMTRYDQRFTKIFGVTCTTVQAATMLINPCMAELTCEWTWLPKEKARYRQYCANSAWMVAPHVNYRNILDAIKALYYKGLWLERSSVCRGYKTDDTPEVRHFFKAFEKFQKLDAIFPPVGGNVLLWTRMAMNGKAGELRQCQAKDAKRFCTEHAFLRRYSGPKLIIPPRSSSVVELPT